MKSEKLTPGSALKKLMVYCRYQERCHSEVREKLASYGVFGADADAIAARLIEENFLNEERFAIQFAGGKFRIKKWGREKIEYALRSKGVSTWCIRKALREIGSDDYEQTFEKLALQQWKRLSALCSGAARKQKMYTALRGRGYDSSRISRYVDEMEKAEKRKRAGKKKILKQSLARTFKIIKGVRGCGLRSGGDEVLQALEIARRAGHEQAADQIGNLLRQTREEIALV